MASAISRESDDRQSLSTYRTMGSTLAGVIIGAGVPLLAYETIDGNTILIGSKFTAIAGVFSILAIVSYIICYFLVTERVVPNENIERKRTTDDKIIRVELTTVIADKIKEISILKSDIEKVEPIKLRRQR